MNRTTRLTQIFIGSMVLAAVASATYAGLHSHTLHLVQAGVLLALHAEALSPCRAMAFPPACWLSFRCCLLH